MKDAMQQRIEGIEEYLRRQKIDVKHEQGHLDEGSRESLYWHYGYLMALKDIRSQSLMGDGNVH